MAKFVKGDWLRDRTKKAMQKTGERLNERTDLTQNQKEKIAGFLNTDRGISIWNKQSLSPNGRIAAARLLSGERDQEQILKGIPRLEQDVVKATLRESGRDKTRQDKR